MMMDVGGCWCLVGGCCWWFLVPLGGHCRWLLRLLAAVVSFSSKRIAVVVTAII